MEELCVSSPPTRTKSSMKHQCQIFQLLVQGIDICSHQCLFPFLHQELWVTNQSCRTPSCAPINLHFLLPLCILSSQHSLTSGTPSWSLKGTSSYPSWHALCHLRPKCHLIPGSQSMPSHHVNPSCFRFSHKAPSDRKSFLNSSFSCDGWLFLSTSVGLSCLSNSLSKNCHIFKITRKTCREQETKRRKSKHNGDQDQSKWLYFKDSPSNQ